MASKVTAPLSRAEVTRRSNASYWSFIGSRYCQSWQWRWTGPCVRLHTWALI